MAPHVCAAAQSLWDPLHALNSQQEISRQTELMVTKLDVSNSVKVVSQNYSWCGRNRVP